MWAVLWLLTLHTLFCTNCKNGNNPFYIYLSHHCISVRIVYLFIYFYEIFKKIKICKHNRSVIKDRPIFSKFSLEYFFVRLKVAHFPFRKDEEPHTCIAHVIKYWWLINWELRLSSFYQLFWRTYHQAIHVSRVFFDTAVKIKLDN